MKDFDTQHTEIYIVKRMGYGINSIVLINREIVIQNGNINESSPLLTAP